MRWLAIFAALCIIGGAQAQPIPPVNSTGSGGLALNGSAASGRTYFPIVAATPTNAAVGAANRLYAAPMFVGAGSVLKSLSFDIGTGNAAAWNARMCVYADNGTGLPGSLITNADTGTIAIGSGSVTGVQTATVNGATGVPVSGWIWLAFMADSSSESVFSWGGSINTIGALMTSLLGATSATSVFSGTASSSLYMAQTFGACPSSFGAVTYNNGASAPFIVAGF